MRGLVLVQTVDSSYAWSRLLVTLALMTLGASGMYVVPVVLPAVQAEFGVARADASAPYALLMIGFGVGGVLMGKAADRFGVWVPLAFGGVMLGIGFAVAATAPSILVFTLAHGVLIGLLGSSATFAPLMADTSLWFAKRRGIAVAICASGNYLGGTIWPPIVQHFVEVAGWRTTYFGMAVVCGVGMFTLAMFMKPRPPVASTSTSSIQGSVSGLPFGLRPNFAMTMLMVAGVACCVAMSMPQVHIVAYCGDLGYGAARGAEMLSLMLGFGIMSRLLSGWICDLTGSYHAAFLNGIGWNLLNLAIAGFLLYRLSRRKL